MNQFDKIAQYSALPIVDLNHPGRPHDGLSVPLTDSCRKHLTKGDACIRHYEEMVASGTEPGSLVSCPFGFASVAFRAGDIFGALTGFIPYPRLGGTNERIVAKRHKEARVTIDAITGAILTLKEVSQRFEQIEDEAERRLFSVENEAKRLLHEIDIETAKKHSMALHEIRKLNRTVVQTAERLCLEQSPQSPEQADSRIVNIWKTAELMSKQFDVVEILANESLTKLPVKTPSQLYKIFDKCVRVFQTVRGPRSLFLQAPQNYSPRIHVCEKTFPIIPTVLISNALKYSKPNTEVRVILEPDGGSCVASVISVSEGQMPLDDSIFQRGVRISSDSDGSGNGLYVAQLVARQHATKITVQSIPDSHNNVKHIFRVPFRVIKKSSKGGVS
jgi:hypothetical protein